jgi:NTP pyrophosphatase (non-canonical NTP hydrolase)
MKDLEREIMQFMKERSWHTIRPSDVAKSIVIEAAELLELFQWTSMTIAETKKNKKKMEQIKDELADVFTYCLDLAITLGLDSEKIIRDKLEVSRKKYPAALMRKMVNRKDPGTEKIYLKIKEDYRRRKQK